MCVYCLEHYNIAWALWCIRNHGSLVYGHRWSWQLGHTILWLYHRNETNKIPDTIIRTVLFYITYYYLFAQLLLNNQDFSNQIKTDGFYIRFFSFVVLTWCDYLIPDSTLVIAYMVIRDNYYNIVIFSVSSVMSLSSTNAYKGLDRAFCIRMKSTLTKRGCHFKSSGYRVSTNTQTHIYRVSYNTGIIVTASRVWNFPLLSHFLSNVYKGTCF